MTAFLVMLQAPDSSNVSTLWPVTIAGWVAFVAALSALIGGFVAAGKFLGTLNGFGVRLGDVEKGQKELEGQRSSMQRQIDRILDQHESMIERLGESKRSAEKCSEETQEIAINIGSRIDTLSRDVNAMNNQLSQRLTAVETAIKLKRE